MFEPVNVQVAVDELSSGMYALHGAIHPIYKGTGRLDINVSRAFRFKSVAGMRSSLTAKEKGGEYDLLLNGLPSWQVLPRRDSSLVASTSRNTAKTYGQVWRVVLPDNGRLVLSPRNDIWYSFNHALGQLGLGGAEPVLFRLNEAITSARLRLGRDSPTSYGELIEILERIGSAPPAIFSNEAITTGKFYRVMRANQGNIETLVDTVMSPFVNGFRLISVSHLDEVSQCPDHEVWTDSNCLVLHETILQH